MPVSQTRIRVRYAETDQMGVVYYANFFIWFEIGRVELLRELGFHYKQMEIDDNCHIPVVEASCRYKSPAHYDDELVLETRTNCDSPATSLRTYDPAANTSTVLLGPPRNGGDVNSAISSFFRSATNDLKGPVPPSHAA